MDAQLIFSGSEALCLAQEGDALVLRFAVACVQRRAHAGLAPEEGYLRPLSMRFSGASLASEGSDTMGAIGEGWVQSGEARLPRLPLPWRSEGPVTLTLHLRQGTVWRIHALAAECLPGPDARFTESYAC